jgi:DNA-binding MarR family transcriptional regulator
MTADESLFEETTCPLRDELDRLRDDFAGLQVDHAQRIIALEKSKNLLPSGKKTIARISMIEEILIARGSTTFKELERLLKISPGEMTRLISKLDKRKFEVHPRPNHNREKVLRRKQEI